jgi:hypothetical protein
MHWLKFTIIIMILASVQSCTKKHLVINNKINQQKYCIDYLPNYQKPLGCD